MKHPSIAHRGKERIVKKIHCLSLISQSFVQSLAVVCSYVTSPFLSIFENLFPHSGQTLQTLPLKESYSVNSLCLLTLRNPILESTSWWLSRNAIPFNLKQNSKMYFFVIAHIRKGGNFRTPLLFHLTKGEAFLGSTNFLICKLWWWTF